MTSVAVAPGSLGASPAMLTPKMYHLQQGLSPSGSPTSGKSYDTLSKGKKSWSVRLGLSRQHQNHGDDPGKGGWGTISGGSILSRQMIYSGDPWLYGTVRSSRLTGHDPARPFLTPPPLPGATPLLVVCSCPEFLTGTVRKLGSCRKCGGQRVAGLPFGGTCRLPSSSRSRPSLAGVLRTTIDDPYDQMRRNRLVEPRSSRARSISPHRPSSQRDSRSQSMVSRAAVKERKGTTENTSLSRSEWFDKEPSTVVSYDDRKSRPGFISGGASSDDWMLDETPESHSRIHSTATSARLTHVSKKPMREANQRRTSHDDWKNGTTTVTADSRKSILECNVNPYLLLKKQKDEDDLSDDLSDNALEQDDLRTRSSSLFDSSKVKSIERIPNRNAVAAIGGQRIRVFNERPREISDDDDDVPPPVTRIPIPKVSPKRPPRRLKEARQTLKSILKRGREIESKRKNVLFNVDNVIFAPEKPSEATRLSWSRIGRIANCNRIKYKEPKIVPEIKKITPPGPDKIKIDKFVPSRKFDRSIAFKKQDKIGSESSLGNSLPASKIDVSRERILPEERRLSDEKTIRLEDETELEIEIEELKDRLPGIAVDEKDLILKSEENSRKSFLTRSQSDRSFNKPEISAGDVLFSDTMRLSLSKKIKESSSSSSSSSSAVSREDVDEESSLRRKNETREIEEETDGGFKNSDCEIETSKNVDEIPDEKTADNAEKEVDLPPDARSDISDASNEHFRTMRPTSWSPPPGRQRHRFKIGYSSVDADENPANSIRDHRRTISSASTASWNSTSSYGSSKIEINSPESNVCKITVSPRSSPLVHRLQIGPESSPRGARRTSILINGDQSTNAELTPGNKVTISVGGEDSVCNPTVISVNSENPPKVQNAVENRTLVILQNYKSNIVVESMNDDSRSKQIGKDHVTENSEMNLKMNGEASKSSNDDTSLCRHMEQSASNFEKQKRLNVEIKSSNSNQSSRFYTSDERMTQPESKTRFKNIENSSKLPSLSKEALISKLLEDSLRKARENGEILDEDSGQAILKILKQSLLKSKEYESSESTLEANYSRSSSLNSDGDFISTNLFLEENPYEVIKEPIYEEIPDEPPPLPLSPPPTEDYIKDRIYFGDVEYYKKITPDQFFGPYLSEEVFKKSNSEDLAETYLSKSPEDFFKKMSMSPEDENNISTKFELLNFLMDSKDRTRSAEEDEDEDEDEEDDAERDLEALYEQKETSLGDLSSKSSQISNVSDSSEECNIILTSSPETLKSRTVDIERTDSGVGSESSQASSTRCVARRWRTGNVSSGPGSLLGGMPQVISGATKLCEDCEQRLDPLITDSGVVYAPFVCRKCSKKRAERKEIITEIVETEQKYGRDLQIILEEFHRPMLRAGLLTSEQLSAIFLNVEELLEHNLVLAEKLKDNVELAQESGDEDLLTVDVGKIFLESERMLHAFESYCTRQGGASLLLQNLEKEKELLRIFLRVSQMENTVLRRMNLNSFLMVPVQRVTKYPLLLARLLKATPSVRPDIQEAKKRLKQAQTNIELHLEHMNAEAKDVTSTKLWRRISIIQNGRRSVGEQDMVNIKLRKMAVEILEWAHEEARFVLEGRLLVAQPTDNNWRRGRTVKLAPVTAMLVTNGKPNADYPEFNDESLFPKHIGIKEATLLLVKEKLGRYSLLREPLYLDKCIVCCETDLEDYFEIQELSSKETFIFKAEDGARTKRWCRTLQAHAQSLGAWRKRRGALPNIMICGVARN
ncbi:Myosin-M heavy chain [Atta colombica]|uniref:Myosin-M heavy chain n=1 Tax=Atta colombica TaxID=520822 RepID=A0A195B4F7_9HYME|nr:Myosin-M heavy chain [Atta colombica]